MSKSLHQQTLESFHDWMFRKYGVSKTEAETETREMIYCAADEIIAENPNYWVDVDCSQLYKAAFVSVCDKVLAE